ncbi:MAG: hypothetical protein HY270_21290 [Deltaproteobacteria bacterium]|nr:hypothetical protein [Deltaproteobacteria bacterium]
MTLILIRICAVLIGLRSLTNFGKVLNPTESVLVCFGQILHGSAVPVPSFALGAFMLATAIAMWKPSRWALPLAASYALYVPINLVLWTFTNPEQIEHVGTRLSSSTSENQLWWFGALGFFVYSAVAIFTTAGPAWLLWRQRAQPPR